MGKRPGFAPPQLRSFCALFEYVRSVFLTDERFLHFQLRRDSSIDFHYQSAAKDTVRRYGAAALRGKPTAKRSRRGVKYIRRLGWRALRSPSGTREITVSLPSKDAKMWKPFRAIEFDRISRLSKCALPTMPSDRRWLASCRSVLQECKWIPGI